MDLPAGDILRDTRSTAVPGFPGRYRLTVGESWRVFYAFGGMTMASALAAIEAELDRPDLRLVSADATFCQAVPCGPVAIEVEVLRRGRGAAQAQARLWVTDDPTGPAGADLVVTAVFGLPRDSPYAMVGAAYPADAPSPADSRTRPEAGSGTPFDNIPYHLQTDWRLALGHAPWESDIPAGEARAASWFRFKVPPLLDDGTWSTPTLAVPGDVLAPAVVEGVGRTDGFFLVVTLQLSMQFFAPMRGEWLLQHTRAHHAGDGFATGVAELWSEDRTLVALATQCALLQPLKRG